MLLGGFYCRRSFECGCGAVVQVLLYSGQLDVIVAAPLTEAMLQTVQWKYLSEYQRSKRIVWKVCKDDVEVAGYVRRVHDFYQVRISLTLPMFSYLFLRSLRSHSRSMITSFSK